MSGDRVDLYMVKQRGYPCDSRTFWLLVDDASTLDRARRLARRLGQRIDNHGHPVDREATVCALLDLLNRDQPR